MLLTSFLVYRNEYHCLYLLQAELDKENDYFMRHASPIRDEFDDEDEYMMTTGLVTTKILFAN